jgi:hypothetical protein
LHGARYKNASTVADCCVMECDIVYSGIQTCCARMPELREENVVEHHHSWTIMCRSTSCNSS